MAQTDTHDRIIRTDYSEIMQKNYIDYAMSVIVSRALPDVRDGLKPVQRRVLFDMWELGTRSDRPYRKCARIVGDTMGKYHPHGDSSIYDALVVMAQEFKKGSILVDGHGNFGSIEGDGAAAMRYTEARLRPFTEDVFLADLEKNLVEFMPNFDETEKEPTVLPARLPNILINGSEGIAVGMATSIPPHNLGEVIDAVIAAIRNESITEDELLKFIKGPDFPTGGIIVNKDELKSIYAAGSGRLRVRGRTAIEKGRGGRTNIVVTEIPYTMIGSGIGKFLNDVAALAENRTCPDIVDISNQSSKEGIRIVIELKKGADADSVLNVLLKKTKLEDTFGVNMLVVADGRPETMSLKQIIDAHVDFQFEIADRKYSYLLSKELEQKEIQEGLIAAVDVIDLIIEILRGSKNRKMAMDCLVLGKTDGIRFRSEKSREDASALMFTERQAGAILDMRLVKLIGLEIDALMKDHEETLRKINLYTSYLEHHDKMAEMLTEELKSLKKKYAVRRRTSIENAEEIVLEEREVEEEEVVFCLDRFGYAKVLDLAAYEKNKEAAEAENRFVFRIMNTDKVQVFTDIGKLHTIKVLDLPQKKLRDKGVPIDNLSRFSNQDEEILFVGPMTEIGKAKLFFASRSGNIKLVDGSEFVTSVRTIASTKLMKDDRLIMVGRADCMEQVVLLSHGGYSLRFTLAEVSEMKKTALGVRGMLLEDDDCLDGAYLLTGGADYTVKAGGTTLHLNRLKMGKRAQKGVKSRRS
jgi:DNA gyrase subunit A